MAENKEGGTVWHVDDQHSWRQLVSRILGKDGHQVVSTPSATEAKRMIPGDLHGVSVSILDGDLGDGTGAELADLIRQSQLPIGIIGLSGSGTPWADVSLNKDLLEHFELVEAVNRFLRTQK